MSLFFGKLANSIPRQIDFDLWAPFAGDDMVLAQGETVEILPPVSGA